ncbi:tetratricopeptide repeat protein [Treponema pedis]|uniref:tetratricopeptide repeat protein n=1 Tax=Treponema pedis TaxID=409322 RepID=UPI0003F7ED24|nr:tetratricopeptide repeat protein [Treponema pedis]
MYNSLNSLLYVTVPEEQAKKMFPGFDGSIPLPVQLPEFYEPSDFKPEDLEPEMLLAGMLTVFAYNRENIHIERYRKIFNMLKPDIRKEMTEAAIIKSKNGDFDTAEELLLALEGLFPQDKVTKLNLALLMEERAAFCKTSSSEGFKTSALNNSSMYTEKAEILYNELIVTEPPLPEAFFNAAYFFMQHGKYEKTKSLLQTYLQIETSVSDTAEIRKQKASELLNSIKSQSLDDKLFSQSYILMQEGNDKDAAENIKIFLQHNPKSPKGWFLLGWALRRMERWEDGKAALLKALELLHETDREEEFFCEISNEAAICCMELNLFNEAEQHLLNALSSAPENIKIISNLGTLALKQGKKEEAEAFFKTVLELNPNDEIAKNVLTK